MTKIDFYTGSKDKLRTACQLSHKAMQSRVRVMFSTPDSSTSHALDKLLWEFPANAFIPHCLSNTAEAETIPVVINHDDDKFPDHELLISLHPQTINFFSRFERVIEIVSVDEADSRMGRERYKFYKDRGFEIRHIDLNQIPANMK
ncbi:MAG: DNA polymerase III subunit chi [Gallionella sp.]